MAEREADRAARQDNAVSGTEGSIGRLAAAWRQASRVVALTGAGMSTASGIPDFRSPAQKLRQFRQLRQTIAFN